VEDNNTDSTHGLDAATAQRLADLPQPGADTEDRPDVGPVFGPGPARVANGGVFHLRHQPAEHRFTAAVRQVWIDPDHPEAVCDRHPLWSATRPSPVRFKRKDYFDGTDEAIGPKVRDALADVLGARPEGPLRMLTQPRTWGWLFNPLSLYFVWPEGDDGNGDRTDKAQTAPHGVLLEVDNTPWHERHHYAVALRPAGNRLVGNFAKVLHVSPFLDEDFDYRISVGGRNETSDAEAGLTALDVTINVLPRGSAPADEVPTAEDLLSDKPILHTRLRTQLRQPTRAALGEPLRPDRLPTHRVSLGILTQAVAIFAKKVPLVRHPDNRKS
jgi:DUF1365 family protein